MQNYYEILGVSANATEKEIRTCYIEKIKKYHPDTFDGDKSFAEKQTALITEAYTTLKDSTLRMRYDLRNNISANSNSSKQTKKSQPQKPKENAQKKTEKAQKTKPQKEQKENTSKTNKKDKKQQKKEEKPVKTDKNDVKKPKYTKKQLIEDIFIVLLAGLLIFILVLAIF